MMPLLALMGGGFRYDFKIEKVFINESSNPIIRVFVVRFPSIDNVWQFFNHADYLAINIPDWVDGALKKACAPNPKDRYSAFSEFLYDLKTPNNALVQQTQFKPLLKRNPNQFWQATSALLLLALLGSLFLG